MPEVPFTKGRKDIPQLSESEDQALGMILALLSEVSVMRARIDTLERLLGAQGMLASGAVDAYVPDHEAATARDGLRQRIIAKVMRPIRDAARRAVEDRRGRSSREA